jgi:uncharacterized protein
VQKTNRLIHSTSPYLLQHAHNPVNWYPWGEEALTKARQEKKLMIISIGYSACHWCHVMEHESFEDDQVAEIMNSKFICIKVDREERPDLDQVYMSAVQLMTGRGGWPLNCITLPDGRPVFGGTYFQKQQWMSVLTQLAELFETDRSRLEGYAAELLNGMNKVDEIISFEKPVSFHFEPLQTCVSEWKKQMDFTEGGSAYTPKFPMPGNLGFLLSYASEYSDEDINKYVHLTLKKMAFGGIYDQIGGGFARYSVDGVWKVPHFEKMLYDNAQLLSVYSMTYRYFHDEIFKDTAYGIFNFMVRELKGDEGNYFCAIDADSEGEEGKYYTWTTEELQDLLKDDFKIWSDYYNVNEKGLWEHGRYIPLRTEEPGVIAARHKMEADEFREKIRILNGYLLEKREQRIKPGLDDKTLTSWNALAVSGFLSAYDVFADKKFLDAASTTGKFILKKLKKTDGSLWHSYKNGEASIHGFLEDYSFVISAFIRLYSATFDEMWLKEAQKLSTYVLDHFVDEPTGLFYFTSDMDEQLIARKMELQDNVIPSSNSEMAHNLYQLGRYFERDEWVNKSEKMLRAVEKNMFSYGGAYSNWLLLYMSHLVPERELVITGTNALQFRSQVLSSHPPVSMLLAGSANGGTLPLLEGRLMQDKTFAWWCESKSCSLPLSAPDKVHELWRK